MTITLIVCFENKNYGNILFKSMHKLKCHCRGLLEAYPIVQWETMKKIYTAQRAKLANMAESNVNQRI